MHMHILVSVAKATVVIVTWFSERETSLKMQRTVTCSIYYMTVVWRNSLAKSGPLNKS